MKKILLACLLLVSLVGVELLWPKMVYAAGDRLPDMCDEGGDLVDNPMSGCEGNSKKVGDIAADVIKVVIGLVAVLAVGVMIFGGIMYTTSVGDAQKAYRARNIIIYGLVGLVVSILAYSIVLFVTQGIG